VDTHAEEGAEEQHQEQRRVETVLRAEINREAEAAAALEGEETQLRAKAEGLLQHLVSDDGGESLEHGREHRHLGGETPLAEEIATLEAELRAQAIGEVPEAHSAVADHLIAVRQALRDENAEWRREMVAVRDAAYARRELMPEARAFRGRVLTSGSSGFQRALRGWDDIMGEDSGAGVSPPLRAAALPEPSPQGLSARASTAVMTPSASPAAGPLHTASSAASSRRHRDAVAQALDTLDAYMEGEASRDQADTEWTRIAEDKARHIAALKASPSTLAPEPLAFEACAGSSSPSLSTMARPMSWY